jgi:peptidoglycan hydrolase-like protein with peptidoglycan-binding domain
VNRHLTRRQPHLTGSAKLHSTSRRAGFGAASRLALHRLALHRLALLGWVAVAAMTAITGIASAQSQDAQPAPAASPSGSASSGSALRPTLKLGSQGAAVSELQAMLKLLGYYAGSVDGLYQQSTADAVSAFQQGVQLQSDGIAGTATWSKLLPATPQAQAAAPASVIPSGATLSPVTPTQPSPSPVRPSFPATSPVAPTVAPTVAPSPTQGYTPVAPAPAPAPTVTATSPATGATETALRRGMEGEAVTQLQTRLEAIGVFSGSIDGVFGAETELAVQQAQRNFGLEPDGVVGSATWEALRR